ncbi:MAG: hypothetical protein M0Z87_11925 [Actinomycetota bacterium]|nr:hypothetical protein [Actinomycetota bacterium]
MTKLDQIAADAESHDFAAEMADATWEDATEEDPMVTTSLRLPKSLLDWVRERATEQHLRPSVLIRQWIEQRRDAGGSGGIEELAMRMERLERAVFAEDVRPDQR